LQLGADTGLPLAILFLSFVGYILFSCIRLFKTVKTKKSMKYKLSAGLIIVAISIILMQLFDLGLLMSYRLNFLFWICLAIPYSLASQPKVSKAL
jgi:hypothetical protein